MKESHAEYQELQMRSMHLAEDTPALWKLMNDSNGVTLDSEDHEALHKYFEIENGRQTFELEYYFFAGQMMAFSYGSMLAQLKKELLGENSEISSHLLQAFVPMNWKNSYRKKVRNTKNASEKKRKARQS